MSRSAVAKTQHEWIGTKPSSQARLLIAIATISAIVAVVIYVIAERALNLQSPSGGMLMGILSGLLTSGVIAGVSWLVYDSFLPMQRHIEFRPKVDGKWFAYYPVSDDGERMTEYVYMKQIADKVGGKITSHQNAVSVDHDFIHPRA